VSLDFQFDPEHHQSGAAGDLGRARKLTTTVGIIPRAAQLLFEKLDGPKHSRTQSSGLRTPARYSMASPQNFSKSPLDKNWQMKATYVEVRIPSLEDMYEAHADQ
jgi:kinesin family protein 4/21/27